MNARRKLRRRRPMLWAGFCTLMLFSSAARGQGALAPADDGDAFLLRARSSTYLQLFERALLPGPGGATVSADRLAPIFEYLEVRATGIDTAWAKDSLDFEVSGWAGGQLLGAPGDPAYDGDVTVATVSHRLGPATISLGRQMRPGGTFRVLHFDGVALGLRSPTGIGASGYAGFTVLPRWSQRAGYQHLGSAADSLLTSPDALPEPERSGNWLAGARVDYADPKLGTAGVSFHQEQERAELGRRDVGIDAQLIAIEPATLTAAALLDTDSATLADALAALDVAPTSALDLTAEYHHSDPRLLLSRQSVLSVFSTSQYNEVGAAASYRFEPPIEVGGAGYLQWFGPDATGTRLSARVGVPLDRARRSRASLSLGRVKEPENGYVSLRLSVSYLIIQPLRATAEHYSYFYDTPVLGVSSALVEAVSAEWSIMKELRVLMGGSFARSPYAALDAQALARVVCELPVQGGMP